MGQLFLTIAAAVWIIGGVLGYFIVRAKHRKMKWRWTVNDRRSWIFACLMAGPILPSVILLSWIFDNDQDANW
jgi:hypothetical protein